MTTTSTVIRYWSVAEKNSLLVPFNGLHVAEPSAVDRDLVGRCSAASPAVFRLRLQHSGRARRKAPRRPRRVSGVVPIPTVSHRYDTSRVAPHGVARSAVSTSVRSFARRRSWRSPRSPTINLMIGAWYTAHPERLRDLAGDVGDFTARRHAVYIFVVLLATLYGGELVGASGSSSSTRFRIRCPCRVGRRSAASLSASFCRSRCCSSSRRAGGMAMQLVAGYARLQPLLYLEIVGAHRATERARRRRAGDGRSRDREPEVRRPSDRHRLLGAHAGAQHPRDRPPSVSDRTAAGLSCTRTWRRGVRT